MRYAEELRWEVFPGTWLEEDHGVPRCSCRVADCSAPGAHARRADWPAQATSSTATIQLLWSEEPSAAVLLPTGRLFDVISVPETAGCLALARLERLHLPVGPISCTPDQRMHFFVRAGAAATVPERVRHLGWAPGALDLAAYGQGGYVVAPPSRVGHSGRAQWVREPHDEHRWLPETDELIPSLAYACGREAAVARGR